MRPPIRAQTAPRRRAAERMAALEAEVPSSRTSSCARLPRWRISAAAPSARPPMHANMRSTSFARDMLTVADNLTPRHRRGAGGSARQRPGAGDADRRRRGDRARARADAQQVRRPPDRGRRPEVRPGFHQAMYEVADAECPPAPSSRSSSPATHRRPRAPPGAGGDRQGAAPAGQRQPADRPQPPAERRPTSDRPPRGLA